MPPIATPQRRNTFDHREFPADELAPRSGCSVSLCLPARDEAATIGPIVESLAPLLRRGIVEQLVVVDDSSDGTAEIAAAHGAEVHRQRDLCPELGPVLGKGDALWRSLGVLRGDIVCFLDADSGCFDEHFARGLIGPLLRDPELALVKGFYRRPLRVGSETLPDGGGRVTELTARPLLEAFYPELAQIRQPLAGELAARRELLERLPFATGYQFDIALLIDTYLELGIEAIAQVDLDVRQNDHKPLHELGPMAYAVLQAVAERLRREGRLLAELGQDLPPADGERLAPRAGELVERAPFAQRRAAAL